MGDVGRVDEDGYVFLSDRAANMIISGGVNIYPAEIEQVLDRAPGGRRRRRVRHPRRGVGRAGEGRGRAAPTATSRRPSSRPTSSPSPGERLAGFKVPRSVDFEDELPRHPTGKLYTRLLRDRYWSDGRAAKV